MTGKEREALLIFLFGDGAGEAAAHCRAWMQDEPRFVIFLDRHRDKVRKKARSASGAEGLRDLLAELEVAQALLGERRFELTYEAYAAGKVRGPDFTVTYKTHIPFNVEVKRLRAAPGGIEPRFTSALCEKLRQMPPATVNALVVLAPETPDEAELAAMLRRLVERAERGDEVLFTRHGFAGTREFFAGFRRLSAVVARPSADAGAEAHAALWRNPQARHPLQPELLARLAERMG